MFTTDEKIERREESERTPHHSGKGQHILASKLAARHIPIRPTIFRHRPRSLLTQ